MTYRYETQDPLFLEGEAERFIMHLGTVCVSHVNVWEPPERKYGSVYEAAKTAPPTAPALWWNDAVWLILNNGSVWRTTLIRTKI